MGGEGERVGGKSEEGKQLGSPVLNQHGSSLPAPFPVPHPFFLLFTPCPPPRCRALRVTITPLLEKVISDAVALGEQKAVQAAIELERSVAEAAEIEAAEAMAAAEAKLSAAAVGTRGGSGRSQPPSAAGTPLAPSVDDGGEGGRRSGRARVKSALLAGDEFVEDDASLDARGGRGRPKGSGGAASGGKAAAKPKVGSGREGRGEGKTPGGGG